ncbi:hypothetical protein ACWDTD_01500 [Gordonia sp. NPDC003425]
MPDRIEVRYRQKNRQGGTGPRRHRFQFWVHDGEGQLIAKPHVGPTALYALSDQIQDCIDAYEQARQRNTEGDT